MLTQAMKNLIEAHGGEVKANHPIKKILIENGIAVGVQTEEGEEFRAPIIVSNAHVQTTMMKMVGREHLGDSMFKKVNDINVGNGFGMVYTMCCRGAPSIYSSSR